MAHLKKIFEPTTEHFFTIEPNLIVLNGQILKN